MQLPDYWLSRPPLPEDSATLAAFDALLDAAIARGPAEPIDYRLAAPRWQLLCHAAERRGLALHGSGNPAIAELVPRRPIDLTSFGSQEAVFAAGDGLWAMYFAIVDRDRFDLTLCNACVRVAGADGRPGEPRYIFSISQSALPQRPWRTGSVYLLPRATFVEQEPVQLGGATISIPQLASPTAVAPLARLEVGPEDFPLLAQMRGHDDSRLAELSEALQRGAPWPA